MKYKILCILCLVFTVLLNVKGQSIIKSIEIQSEPVSLQTQLMNERISELMADRVINNKGIAVQELASIDDYVYEDFDDMLELESMMFPSDELYGYWDTTWVNPYRSREIAYPDSFSVDCSTFVLPIDIGIKVTSVFGVRGRRMHNGIDLKVQIGDTVRSAFSGKVRIKSYERRGYGYYLVIRHQNGLETVYGHLSKFLVAENDIVKAGQPIGLGGNTGRSTGSHLHFETRFLGQALNPSYIIDFNNGGVPHNDQYVLYKESFGKNTNIYTSTSERIVYHRVQKGETLGQIAVKYKTSVAELCRLNGLTTKSVLRVGQSIRCGTTIDKAANAKKEDNSTTNHPILAATSTPATDNTTAESITTVAGNSENTKYHIVKQGETLYSISQQYKTTVAEICSLNRISEQDVLRVGQEIRYNGSQPSTATAITTKKTVQKEEVAQPVYYRIKEGDTLNAIALKHGISVNKLCELNNITRTTILKIGRSLRCS